MEMRKSCQGLGNLVGVVGYRARTHNHCRRACGLPKRSVTNSSTSSTGTARDELLRRW